MTGTIVNVAAILGGGVAGLLFGKAFSKNMKTTITQGIALCVLLIGVQMALQTEHMIAVIISVVLGGMLGEWVDIERRLEQFGRRLEKRFSSGEGDFTKAFVSASLVYCVGAMAIVGSLEDGLYGNSDILFAKAALDGIMAIVFASSMGLGVLFSAIPVLIYQGSITLLAGMLQEVLADTVVTEMSAVGGLLIVAIGINLLEIKKIRIGNLLPAIFIVVPLVLWL